MIRSRQRLLHLCLLLLLGGCRSVTREADTRAMGLEGSASAPPAAASITPAPGASGSAPAASAASSSLPIPTVDIPRELGTLRADPPPRAIIKNRHYLTSNELHPELWADAVKDRGGIHAGVGAEQNLLIAGWSKPEVLILFDFDRMVVDVNWLHGLFLEHARSPEEYLALWGLASEARARSLIRERWPDDREKERVFGIARPGVQGQLTRLKERLKQEGLPSIFEDRATFDLIRRLWVEKRALSILGNLLADTTLKDLAALSRRIRLPIRTLYLSNAEYYFRYDAGSFRENLLALPFDEESVVVHTLPINPVHYWFISQSGKNYQAWLRSGKVGSLGDLYLKAAEKTPVRQTGRFLYVVRKEP